MIKVMVVDDEFIVRKDLRNLIDWDMKGCEIVAEASNGKDGIEKFLKFSPNIVITDIKMPVMNGIEMANIILSHIQNIKFIFLTAYDDFNYARGAIKLGTRSYLLKHEMDAATLESELDNVINTIWEDVRNEKLNKNKIFRRLLNESMPFHELQGLISSYHLPVAAGQTVLLVFDLNGCSGADGLPDPNDNSTLENSGLPEVLTDAFNNMCADIVYDMEAGRCVAAVMFPETHSLMKVNESIHFLCLKIQKQIKTSYKRTVTIGVSKTIDSITDIPGFYKKSLQLMKMKMFYKEESILQLQAAVNTASKKQIEEAGLIIRRFKEFFDKDDYEAAKGELQLLFTDLMISAADLSLLKDCSYNIIGIIYNKLRDEPVELLSKYSGIGKLYEDFYLLSNVYRIFQWLAYLIDSMAGRHHQCYARNIREALKYVQENYYNDITLNQLADVMGVSVIYASQLFKHKVGESFKSYLTNYRIDKATQLLESGKYKIYEVSEMVGYKTIQYFCQTFKRVTGKNPSEV